MREEEEGEGIEGERNRKGSRGGGRGEQSSQAFPSLATPIYRSSLYRIIALPVVNWVLVRQTCKASPAQVHKCTSYHVIGTRADQRKKAIA